MLFTVTSESYRAEHMKIRCYQRQLFSIFYFDAMCDDDTPLFE
jgi:hypothetical protein